MAAMAVVGSSMSYLRNDPSLARFLREGTATGRQLGSGAYGSVEEIEVEGHVCAGKVIHKILLEDENDGAETLIKKFFQECKLMSNLHHPNITNFLGLCFLPNYHLPVLLMERLDGSLDRHLECVPNISPKIKCSILEDVTRGLIYLHNNNPQIIHRDLTAKNVLLTSSRLAKVTDFGNSRIVRLQPGQLAQALTNVPGTLAYMSPEALEEGGNYGSSLDIFSFGHLALFVELQKFPGKLLHHTYPDPKDPGRVIGRSETDRRREYFEILERDKENHPFVQLIKSCLNNDPAKRPTAEQLLSTLTGIKEGMKGQRVIPGLCGLVNLGNTSYMSSALQCLSSTAPVREYFIGIIPPYLRDINKANQRGTGGALARSFSELLWSMWDGTNDSVTPDQFKQTLGEFAPRFVSRTQEDAQEFLTFLLDGLHEDLNKATGLTEDLQLMLTETENTSIDQKSATEAWVDHLETDRSKIVDIFQGQLRSLLICGNKGCKQVVRTFDTFQYLSIVLPDDDDDKSCRLNDCLSTMTVEKGSGAKNWYCSGCNQTVELMNKTDIWKTPEILVVYLKRFRASPNGVQKLNTSVDFPLVSLDLTPFVSNPNKSKCCYDLFATINHTRSAFSGFYSAFVQHDEKWYLFHDKQVTPISTAKNGAQRSTAYVLFYKQKGV